MKRSDFYFDLDEKYIAQKPSEMRGNDKLMVLDRVSGGILHEKMEDFASFVPENALMVFNDSRVRKARVFARTQNGGEQEFLFVRQIAPLTWQVMTRNARRQKCGKRFSFPDGIEAEIVENAAFDGTEFRALKFSAPTDEAWFEKNGHIPLPPYIRRNDNASDSERYQTIYAEKVGSIAAPTAGLHFTPQILGNLREKCVETVFVTLHVGLGTFLPVRSEMIEDHKMHTEFFCISQDAADKINAAKTAGRPVVACGTTSVRTLESSVDSKTGLVQAGERDTDIFIYPGYEFRVVDQIFTNFHTPESTLLMLVSAFAGREKILAAYEEAKACGYRFFSYGDAMLIR